MVRADRGKGDKEMKPEGYLLLVHENTFQVRDSRSWQCCQMFSENWSP